MIALRGFKNECGLLKSERVTSKDFVEGIFWQRGRGVGQVLICQALPINNNQLYAAAHYPPAITKSETGQ